MVQEQVGIVEPPPVEQLARFAGNPVLEFVKEHVWESKYVFNPGAIRLDGNVYLVYRAVGEDGVSQLGLAVSQDGFEFTERSKDPIFKPEGKSETRGCEDPRLTLIGDRIYMLYTAYNGLIAQIALASISVDDFLNYRWGAWRRYGLVLPGLASKNATLFPERLDGKFVMLHRIEPHIWITFADHLRCPWPGKEHRILAPSASETMWDGRKIGAGSQPLKTEYGWLLITHGADNAGVYRLGVMLLDSADPTILRYRSAEPVLVPVEPYEVGEMDRCWVPNVVFTCGVVPLNGSGGVLDAADEVLVYYGAADTAVCVATARIGDLLPLQHRGN